MAAKDGDYLTSISSRRVLRELVGDLYESSSSDGARSGRRGNGDEKEKKSKNRQQNAARTETRMVQYLKVRTSILRNQVERAPRMVATEKISLRRT